MADTMAWKLIRARGDRTRASVARDLGISYSSMCAYEYGKRVPSDGVKQKIADYYSMSVQELFFDQKCY